MICEWCAYEDNCSLRDIAPDITGCTGHSRMKPETEKQLDEGYRSRTMPVPRVTTLDDLNAGDRVMLCENTLGTKLPRYLENGALTVIGFTKAGTVKCDWDGGKPFNIPPNMLKKL